jgi:hypothetical protein
MADSSDTARLRPMRDRITLTSFHIANLNRARIADASAATALLPWDDDHDDDNGDNDD